MPRATRRPTTGNIPRSGRSRRTAAGSALSICGARMCRRRRLQRLRRSTVRRNIPGRESTMRTNGHISSVLAATLAVALMAGCLPAAAPPMETRKADEAAITAAGVALAHAAEAKDLDQCISFYVDGPVLLVPGGPAGISKDAVRQAFAGFLGVQALKLETSGLLIDVAQSGDLAFERGSYSNTITDEKGKTTTETGKLALVWKKQADGSWKIAADTNASDK